MSKPYQELKIPPAASEQGGLEVLRCAIVEGTLQLAMRPALAGPDDWGRLFAEVARQVARVYAHEKKFPEAEMLARIGSSFEAEMKSPTSAASEIGPIGER